MVEEPERNRWRSHSLSRSLFLSPPEGASIRFFPRSYRRMLQTFSKRHHLSHKTTTPAPHHSSSSRHVAFPLLSLSLSPLSPVLHFFHSFEREVDFGGVGGGDPEMDPSVLDDIIKRLREVRLRPGKQVQLSESEIRQLCVASKEIFLKQPNLLELCAPIKICGTFMKPIFFSFFLFLCFFCSCG